MAMQKPWIQRHGHFFLLFALCVYLLVVLSLARLAIPHLTLSSKLFRLKTKIQLPPLKF